MEVISHDAKIIRTAKPVDVLLSPVGGDPLTQVYSEELREYVPDRAILPLTLAPTITREGEDVSTLISSQGWYIVNADGTEQQITTTTTGHKLLSTTSALRLQVMVNIAPNTAGKYIYRCVVGKSKGMAEIILRTTSNPQQPPTFEIDAPSSEAWNPFRPASEDVRSIRYTIQSHGHTGLSVRILKVEDGTPREIDFTDPKDAELEDMEGGIKINRRWMGHSVSLVFELIKGGVVMGRKYYTVTRRIPEMECRVKGATAFSDDASSIYREIEVRLSPGGILSNPSQELKIDWYEGSAVVGSGNNHTYDCKGKEELKIKATVDDRGPCCLATINGAYLTINGKLIGIR